MASDNNKQWAEALAQACNTKIGFAQVSPKLMGGYMVYLRLLDGTHQIARYQGSGWDTLERAPDWVNEPFELSDGEFSEEEIDIAMDIIQTG